MNNHISLTLLGSAQIRFNDAPIPAQITRKAQALLFYLAVNEGTHTRSEVADLLWSDMTSPQALKNLRTLLPIFRKIFGRHLHVTRHTIAFNRLSPYQLDVEEFYAILSGGLTQLSVEELGQGVALYGGEFLQGFYVRNAPAFEMWVEQQRTEYQALAVAGLTKLAALYVEQGDFQQGLAVTNRLLAMEPWLESAHHQQMLLLIQSGQRGAALAQYQSYVEILLEEFGAEPASETTSLYEKIRSGTFETTEPQPLQAQYEQSDHTRPLIIPDAEQRKAKIRPFLPQLSSHFGERAAELQMVLQFLAADSACICTISGVNGIGKTSLLQAVQQRIDNASESQFPDGIHLIPLPTAIQTTIQTTANDQVKAAQKFWVITQIAETIGCKLLDAKSPIEQLVSYLQAKRLLLMLDRFDPSLLPGEFVAKILLQAPSVKLLIAAEKPLGFKDEQVVMLAGLRSPTEGTQEPHDSPGARIFLAYAKRQGLDGAALSTSGVSRLCRLLAGVPLALELATHLSAGQGSASLADQIGQKLEQYARAETKLLSNGEIRVNGEESALNVVLEITWHRLSDREQEILMRLSLFDGAFQDTIAHAIGLVPLSMLKELASSALLRRVSARRYIMHDAIRLYITEQRRADPKVDQEMQTRFCSYYATWLVERATNSFGDPKTLLDVIAAERQHLLLAWQWSRELKQHSAQMRLRQGLQNYFRLCHSEEGQGALPSEIASLFGEVGDEGLETATVDSRFSADLQKLIAVGVNNNSSYQ